MERSAPDRLRSLDLIRGFAVMGILAVNIAGMAGPIDATLTPWLPGPASLADEASFAFILVVFEGKMRMLFSMLFGASMMLFLENAEVRGRNADMLQLRRLGWLMLFGQAHYVLLWWGDILFTYAAIGLIALALRRKSPEILLVLAGMIFAVGALFPLIGTFDRFALVERIHAGTASASEVSAWVERLGMMTRQTVSNLAMMQSSFAAQFADRAWDKPFWLMGMATGNVQEILPMMLIGMAFQKSGAFAGAWPRARLRRIAAWGVALGGIPTALVAGWAWARHFPAPAMGAVIHGWLNLPHLAMALGYLALLILAAPAILKSPLGQRIEAAGRVAFSNYLGTTMVMSLLFSGWGMALAGKIAPALQWLFVLGAWALMLVWSKPWLARHRQGPLEWAWRSLTEWKALPNRLPTTIPG